MKKYTLIIINSHLANNVCIFLYFRYIVLVSGLNFSSLKDNCFAIQLFADWLCGLVGGHQQRNDVSKIVRLIIAGVYH